MTVCYFIVTEGDYDEWRLHAQTYPIKIAEGARQKKMEIILAEFKNRRKDKLFKK